ncbi:MAG: pyocin knob domain-containing protein [Candidatus Fimenecus sp.]
MYPITDNTYKLFTDGGLQKAIITVFQKDGIERELTDADICTNGLSVDRYSTTGQKIEIGSAIASELTLLLRNDGSLNDWQFQGAELFVEVGVQDTISPRAIVAESDNELQTEQGARLEIENFNRLPDDTSYSITYIPLGWFKVDNPPRALSTISISALDRMIRFDRYVKRADIKIPFPCTVSELLLEICRICGVVLADNDVSSLTNAEYEISNYPEQDNLTYRTLLIWIAQITGTCAYMDYNGQLRLEWYGKEMEESIAIDETRRYSSDLQEQYITITGVEIRANGEIYQDKEYDTYVVSIEGNLLIQENAQSVVDNLGNKIIGFCYIPFEAKTMSMPFLFPTDSIDFVKNGKSHKTILTNVNYTLNGSTALSAKGETEDVANSPNPSPFSPSQSKVIEQIQETAAEMQANLSTYEQATDNLNKTASSAMGLFYTERSDGNGGTIRYWHDRISLEDSEYICMQNANGSFSTNTGWNDGNPHWTEGTDKFGNAICSLLNVIGIQAEWIRADSITTDKLSIGQVERGTNLIEDSSFESNSLCVRGTYDEDGTTLVTPGHNDYWNAVCFSASDDEYDTSYVEVLYAPSVGGFDGNKGILDVNLKGLSSDEELWFTGVEHIEPIPVEMMSHVISFYYRVKNAPSEQTQTAEIVHAKYAFKIQWLDINKNPISSMMQSFDARSDGTSEWNRIHADVIPVNGAKYAKFAIGFNCTDEPVWDDGGETGEQGFKDVAFLDLDGILFEQGTALNAWTCAQSEVENTGVIINAAGLNIADGKIYVTDPFGRKVFYIDGQQAMQLIGGFTTQIFDPVSKKVYAQSTIQPVYESYPFDESGSLTGSGYLRQVFEKADENGKMQTLASIGMTFSNDASTNNDYPLSFFSKNGFDFNGANPLISEATEISENVEYLSEVQTPGWYIVTTDERAASIIQSPVSKAFSMQVCRIGDYVTQYVVDRTGETHQRVFNSKDTSISGFNWYSFTGAEIGDTSLGLLSPGVYIQLNSVDSSLVQQSTDTIASWSKYPTTDGGIFEHYASGEAGFQRYTDWRGQVWCRNYTKTYGLGFWRKNNVKT